VIELSKVRVAKLEDVPQILELEKRNQWRSNANLRALFRLKNPNEKCKLFVAKESGEIVGYSRVHLYRWNNSALITTVLVDVQHRRRGVGTRLLKVMEDFARKSKARVLIIDVPPDNFPALQLYFKNGFQICGYNAKIYQEGKTAIYLAKDLQEHPK